LTARRMAASSVMSPYRGRRDSRMPIPTSPTDAMIRSSGVPAL
jgi:hypothetical protein